MPLIVLAPSQNPVSGRLLAVLETVVCHNDVCIHHSTDGLEEGLKSPLARPAIAVILVLTRSDLERTVSFRHLLEDFKIILILPDNHPRTIEAGHLLGPRFVLFIDDEFVNIGIVLKNMLQKQQNS